MTVRPWHFLINTFWSVFQYSVKKALTFSTDHVAKLTANEADADILAIKTAFLPFYNAFITAYNLLQSKLGLYHGKTQTTEEMLHELSQVKINEWRGVVHSVFPEGTANELAIFPNKRRPFQEGTYEQRIEAVHTLSTTLATFTTEPALVALAAVVLAYYTSLSGARALQQDDEGSTDTLRTNLKTALKLMCDALYANLGKLMAKYASTPLTVANYYEIGMLTRRDDDESVELGGSLLNNTIFNLNPLIEAEGLNLTATSTFRIRVLGNPANSLTFYSASSAINPPGAGPQFTVNGGSELVKTFLEMGLDTLAFFNIQNLSPFAVDWEIEITE